MRYELLSILGAVGIAAWFLRVERSRAIRRAWVTVFAGWACLVAVPHVALWNEYLRHPPHGAKRLIIQQLEMRGVRYGKTDYWNAYYVSFLTNERIVMAADDFPRIVTYDRLVKEHATEAVRVLRKPCEGGQELIPGVYLCPY